MIGAFQTNIMKRFMSDKQLKDFFDEYQDHVQKKARTKVVTDKDLLILHDYRGGAQISELTRKYKASHGAINTAIRIAALSKLD